MWFLRHVTKHSSLILLGKFHKMCTMHSAVQYIFLTILQVDEFFSLYIFPKYFLNVHITPFIFCANLSSFIYNSDQTPTPTKFLKNCEEIGLFNELKNPFEEAFKKAMDTESQAEVSLTAKKVVYIPGNCHLKIPFHNVHLFIYFSIKILYIFCLIYM